MRNKVNIRIVKSVEGSLFGARAQWYGRGEFVARATVRYELDRHE